MDARQTQTFIAKLYNPGEAIEVAYIHPTKSGAERRERKLTEGLFEEMERGEEAGYNVYVGVLPVKLREAGVLFDRIWVDQDDPSAPWPFGSDPEWTHPIWPQPTTLVKTSEAEGGFRYQAIWKLSEAITADQAKKAMKRLAAMAGADGSVHDARRVLRVPGIINAKRGQLSQLMSTNEDPISIEAFELPEDTAVADILNGPVNNPAGILGEWLEGATEGDRNRKAYVAARFLKGCGVVYEDAGPILKLGAMRCDPELEDHELEHALQSAYRR